MGSPESQFSCAVFCLRCLRVVLRWTQHGICSIEKYWRWWWDPRETTLVRQASTQKATDNSRSRPIDRLRPTSSNRVVVVVVAVRGISLPQRRTKPRLPVGQSVSQWSGVDYRWQTALRWCQLVSNRKVKRLEGLAAATAEVAIFSYTSIITSG